MRRAVAQATLSLSVLSVQMSSVISLQLTLEVASCISFEWQHPTFITKERQFFLHAEPEPRHIVPVWTTALKPPCGFWPFIPTLINSHK